MLRPFHNYACGSNASGLIKSTHKKNPFNCLLEWGYNPQNTSLCKRILASGVFYWSDKLSHFNQTNKRKNIEFHIILWYLLKYLLSHQPGHKFFWLSDDGHKRIPIPEKKDASNIQLVTKSDIYKQVKIIHPKFDSYHRYAGSIRKLAIIQSLTLIPDMLLVSKSY